MWSDLPVLPPVLYFFYSGSNILNTKTNNISADPIIEELQTEYSFDPLC